MNKLIQFYGARLSSAGKHINVTLVEGEGAERQFYTATAKIDENAKFSGKVEGDKVVITMPLLKAHTTNVEETISDDIPF